MLDFHETFPAVVSEKRPKAHGAARPAWDALTPSSFIRTVTVGSGIGPDLLTSRQDRERSRARFLTEAYRRWGITPRPEDAVEAASPRKAAG